MKISSTTRVFNANTQTYVSKIKLDFENIRLYVFNEKTNTYRIVAFTNKYTRDHVKYLYNNHRDKLIKLVDSGKIYIYLCRLERKAINMVYDQAERWAENDKEYLLAKETGNIRKQVGLFNNLKARAEEIMYSCIIYKG